MPVLMTSLNSSLGPAVCRVCLCGEASIPYLGTTPGEPLISPCHCKGTMGLYHRSCLEHWLSTSRTYCCEICKFPYEIGRRKPGFFSYVRAHWYADDEHSHSMGADCTCFLILSPLTLGGSVLCLQNITEKLRYVDENGDFEKAHEILALGLMAMFLMVVFFFWMIFTVLFYLNDFHIWQKKNVILYVIDQLEREDEGYSGARNHLSESFRPLLLKKKLRRFLCCGLKSSSREHTIIPLRDGILDVNPQLVEANEGSVRVTEEAHPLGHPLVSPVSCALDAPQQINRDLNLSTSILVSSPVLHANEGRSILSSQVPTLSTFRPLYTVANAQILASTPLASSPLSTIDLLRDVRVGSSSSDEGLKLSARSVDSSLSIGEAGTTTTAETSPRVETPL